MEPGPSGGIDPVAQSAARVRATLGLATLAMLALSWPLWIESDAFPRVPFVRGLPDPTPRAAQAAFAALLVSTAAAIARRSALVVSLALLLGLILQDQHRFQPWVYQYLVLGLLMATLSEARALALGRVWFAALYLHSGLSKLDVSFLDEMGRVFLETAVRPLGVVPSAWPRSWQIAAILAMPAWEIAIAVALLSPTSRRIGAAGAIVLHGALLGILGPLGLRHSAIVLVWNAAMIVEVIVLFGPRGTTTEGPPRADSRLGPLVRIAFGIAVVLPLGERWGWLDSWPAHALYASHVERTAVYLFEDELESWPEAIRRHVGGEPGLWRRFDLTGWSRSLRGVPVFPQGRACNGLAEALAARYGDRRMIRVIQWGRADRWSGRRDRSEAIGLEAIRRQGERYRLPSQPAGSFLGARARRSDRPASRPLGPL